MQNKKKRKDVADPVKVSNIPLDVYKELEKDARADAIGISTQIRMLLIKHYRNESSAGSNPSAIPMGAN